jgi:hypothetical protein
MTAQEIQSLLDRLRLLVQQLGWIVTKTDISGPDLVVEIRRSKT